jgi:ParB-like chromosome segregation protein Spo0J
MTCVPSDRSLPKDSLAEEIATRIATNDIAILGSRLRPIDRKVVDALVVSMGVPGNCVPPIIVRPDRDHPGRLHLVAGAHRLEAACKRRDKDILAFIRSMTDDEARIVEIKENYERADLTALERSNHRAELVRLIGEKVPNIGHPGRPQPHDKGISKTAAKTGVSRQQIQRDLRIASITPEAQAAATQAGLANNQSALGAIAKVPAREQVEKVKEIAAKPKRTRRPAENIAAERRHETVAAELQKTATEPPAATGQVQGLTELQLHKMSIDADVSDEKFRAAYVTLHHPSPSLVKCLWPGASSIYSQAMTEHRNSAPSSETEGTGRTTAPS